MLHVGMVCQVEIARKISESDLFPLLHTQGSQLCFFVPTLFKAWKERDFFFFLSQINNQVRSAKLVHGLIHGQFWLHSCTGLSLSFIFGSDPFSKELKAVSWGHSVSCSSMRTVSGWTQFCCTPLPQPQPRHWCSQPGQDPPRT